MKDIQLKFIFVVKNAEDITWLAGPLAELKARLLQIRKIWGIGSPIRKRRTTKS